MTPAELLSVAVESATAAGEVLLRYDGRALGVSSKSSPADIVTAADLAAEEAVRGVIRRRRGGDAILGEERGEERGGGSVRWIVDPLDGTVNYVSGTAQWAVSVAAEVEGRAIAGVVHAPRLRRTFTATAAGGSRCNGAALEQPPGDAPPISDCVVGTGLATDPETRGEQLELLPRVASRVRDLRLQGAASLDLCAVAAGELDGYFESGLESWDVAAGRLIAIEAGCRVVGGPPEPGALVAAPAALADELVELLADTAGARR